MTTTTTATDYETKAIEILENLMKTKKLFTAFHITITLRKCGYMVKHYDVRDIVNAYDFAGKGYTKTLSTTQLFKVAANIYHPVSATNQDLVDFEKNIEDSQNKGNQNTPIVAPSLVNTAGPLVTISGATSTHVAAKPYISSIRLKSDTVNVKTDSRGRVCIPANVVRKYFKSGDKVGITATPVNLSIEPFATNGKYSTVMTVDSYDNIRINSKHMHKSNGDITVNFNNSTKTIVLV